MVATTAILYVFRSSMNTSTVALLYLLPVLLCTMLWGLSAGLTAGLLAFLIFNYFFIQPYYTFKVNHTQDITALVIFFVVAVLISQLVGRAKRNLTEAKAREQELSNLYGISSSLAGVNDQEEIADLIATQVQEIFQAQRVEIKILPLMDEHGFSVCVPHESRLLVDDPAYVVPLETSRGVCGEIRLWRQIQSASASEKRMLEAIAAQGALALERASLTRAETKAKVLEESDRMKSALLSSVSHELRTPLSIIKASSTSLLSGEVEWDMEARIDLLNALDEETDHLNQLVGNLLDMSRIEAGALEPNRQWNLLSEIVSVALERMKRALEKYRVEVDISEDLPFIPVDFMQMERVFINLLSNSTKYAPKGTTIRIRAWVHDQENLFVQLTNQSPPVPEEHLESIFEKFHRVTDADRVSGAGLGLSICKGIVEAHGGRIWAENLVDGFAFNLQIPLTWNGRPATVVEVEI
jgi:two-component system sensor histidine kinase KdpD